MLLSALVVLACTATSAPAQTGVDRTQWVYHIYVDPVFGDDQRAASVLAQGQNPAPTGAFRILQDHQDFSGTGPKKIVGRLDHAPYAFRTVTAAIAYVRSWAGQAPYLPFDVDFGSGDIRTISYVVIECLPGLYGPSTSASGLGDLDPKSGLRFNGETFPIQVDDRICIQGTSALDTIFDARGRQTHIFAYSDFNRANCQYWLYAFGEPPGFAHAGTENVQSFLAINGTGVAVQDFGVGATMGLSGSTTLSASQRSLYLEAVRQAMEDRRAETAAEVLAGDITTRLPRTRVYR